MPKKQPETYTRFIAGDGESINIKKEMPKRAISEPPTQSVVKGPREGFIENIDVNLQLVIKRIKSDKLKLEHTTVGRYTQTKVTVAYLSDVADKTIAEKVLARIKNIDIDGIIDSYYVLQFLQDKKSYLFRSVGGDEKPDVTAAKLLEGRIAIFVDGSPIVLSVPYILFEDIQNSDDYYTNAAGVSLRRFIRIVGAVVSILLPGIYIAMQLYHYSIVPLNTLITLSGSVTNTPFSPLVEVLFVLILFEILYEAALRMPRHLGTATSLIGALILGETAVKAGLISSPAVLVAALSGIMMYIIPNLAPQISLLRFFFCILGGIMGLYGLVIGSIILVVYMCGLDSYGAPLLAPYAPLVKSDLKDGIIKKETRAMTTRPKSFNVPNRKRGGHE
ncbi:MAG: spore germination protein [Christensenellaceae bacterium]|jgi:spore germination protein KA|nr:spore germination protein [Christensenellaceae bacterium]